MGVPQGLVCRRDRCAAGLSVPDRGKGGRLNGLVFVRQNRSKFNDHPLFICLVRIKSEEGIRFTIMARRPQETTRFITEATSAVINR